MSGRWQILTLLFIVRTSMAFQFQSVGAIAPVLMKQSGIGIADVGFLISIYLLPGLAFTLPGAEIGRRFGDKRVVLVGLVMMVVGGAIYALGPSWEWQIAGRLIAGVGGVLLNVLMSKMVTDLFVGREIATAMAIFVNSWPAGIALCLFVMPAIVEAIGVTAALFVPVAFCAVGLAMFAMLYRPTFAAGPITSNSFWPTGLVLWAVILAGCIWGLFNAALSMVFSFGPAMLAERNWSLAAAGGATRLTLWIVTLSVPLGGFVADKTGKRTELMVLGFALFAVALLVAARTDFVIPAFVALGVVGGLSAGPIMSLPSRVLGPDMRAAGMGIYFTMFYGCVVFAPIIAGAIAAGAGYAGAAFIFGAAMLAACFPIYWGFAWLAAKVQA